MAGRNKKTKRSKSLTPRFHKDFAAALVQHPNLNLYEEERCKSFCDWIMEAHMHYAEKVQEERKRHEEQCEVLKDCIERLHKLHIDISIEDLMGKKNKKNNRRRSNNNKRYKYIDEFGNVCFWGGLGRMPSAFKAHLEKNNLTKKDCEVPVESAIPDYNLENHREDQ